MPAGSRSTWPGLEVMTTSVPSLKPASEIVSGGRDHEWVPDSSNLPDDRHAEIMWSCALRLSYHLADRSSHSPNHRVHQLRAKRSNRTSAQEIVIDRCDLFAEDHAVVAQPTGACGQNHVCRAHLACGEDWGDYQVVPHSISDVFRDHHRGTRLMRVIWLARCEHVPDLATSGPCRWRPASLAQVADSRRLAADRRIARQAFRSGPITSSSARAYWASIAVSCWCAYHCCSAWSITLLRSWPGCDWTKPSTAPSNSGSSVTLTLIRLMRLIVAWLVGSIVGRLGTAITRHCREPTTCH